MGCPNDPLGYITQERVFNLGKVIYMVAILPPSSGSIIRTTGYPQHILSTIS